MKSVSNGGKELHLPVMPDRLNDTVDRRGHIVRGIKIHVVPAVEDDLFAVR